MKDQPEQMAFYRELGVNIRERRKALNLSQEALARLSGLTRTSLTNIENGRQHPPLHTFCEILAQLKVDASSVLPQRTPVAAANDAHVEAMAAKEARNPDEYAFMTSFIARKKQEKADGDTKEEDRSAGARPPQGEPGHAGAGAGHKNRQGKGRADRR